ncbi:hypothetical protein [Leptospira noguchii]|uniref:Uncharacterized protein n=1 Tax=Leptospira noguchii str. 2001034031 TaxID=1193053 RepID=M6Y405_9LEPT|nr:hypothetical protein [Leptospira noguchii]EMO89037.1 hypothetical protein LEP1GSC024_3636 [Leptospira noguchii str. 2001034031]
MVFYETKSQGHSKKLNASLLWSLWETQCIASMVALQVGVLNFETNSLYNSVKLFDSRN